MMTDEMKKAVREMISEYMEGAESETEKLMEKVACALAERMDVSALEKHAVHEVGQMLDYYGMENVEGVFHEFYELKIVSEAFPGRHDASHLAGSGGRVCKKIRS